MRGETHFWMIEVAAVIGMFVIGWTVYPWLKEQRPRRWIFEAAIAFYGVFMGGVALVIMGISLAAFHLVWHLITGH